MSIAENIASVRLRMAAAAARAGRDASEITLMAVTKTHGFAQIVAAKEAGVTCFGENYVQEAEDKSESFAGARLHLIGHLQSNKAAKAAKLFASIDSLDSLRLAQKLERALEADSREMQAVIEVNIGGEAAKSGIAPVSNEFEELLRAAAEWKYLRVMGLMAVPPFLEDAEQVRPYFRLLRGVRDEIAARQLKNVKMDVLSMGMSHDFDAAIEEGSTMVRVGTAIFGSRATLVS